MPLSSFAPQADSSDWMSRVVGPLRGAIGDAMRSRIAGPDREAKEDRIWRTPGPRWFREGDPIWTVHADPSMYVGGLRALLVQSLHPLAMAGVAGHSGFRGDPWGRLQRTGAFIATTTYARIDDAEALIRAVRSVHSRVSGVDAQGRAYAASDPHLLRWVHDAETESFLTAYQAYGARPLSPVEADTYVAQMASISERLGVEALPRTVAELDADLAGYESELEASPEALDTAHFLLREPPLPWVTRPVYGLLAAAAVVTLPPVARALLELDSAAGRHVPESVVRRGGRAFTGTLRWAIDHPAYEGLAR